MEDSKSNIEESKETTSHGIKTENWKEFDKFYEAHGMQLYGMNFPKELGEKLFYKLKHEIFDSTRFFEVLDNQQEERFQVNAKLNMKKDFEVFLVDHCWTFKIRQFNYFCEKYPNIIDRIYNMLKYSHVKRDIPGLDSKNIPLENQVENINLNKDNSYLELDNTELVNLDSLYHLDKEVQALSLDNNKIEDFNSILEFLTSHGDQIKAIWLQGNPFEDDNEGYEKILEDMFPNLELINTKFTKNAKSWSVEFINKRNIKKKNLEKYDKLYGGYEYIDLSSRDPLRINDMSIFNIHSETVTILDIRDNDYEYEFENKEFITKFLALLKNFPKAEKILVDETNYYDEENFDSPSSQDFLFFLRNPNNRDLIINTCPNLKFINDYSLEKLSSSNLDFQRYIKESRVRKYMWKINQTYRLVTSEKYDEDATWYINDEIGTNINHSDQPNVAMFPFIFSPSNTFKDDMITYSILWPLKDVRKDQEISRDYLNNISESQQRSARLTCWFNTPREYFSDKFNKKIKIYSKNAEKYEEEINTYQDNIKALCDNNVITSQEDFEKNYKKTFNFETLINKEKMENIDLSNITQRRIKESITQIDSSDSNIKISTYFIENFVNKNIKIKVFSDLPYVRENITNPHFEITNNLDDADILWLNSDYFKLAQTYGEHLKPRVYKNQFPFENIITMKSHMTDLVQSNMGLNKFLNLSYSMDSELAEIIGNYFYNEENLLDNSWILKPINMSRSMDMIVTNNLDEIIRSVETGPKICQKYLERPFLLHKKKFDLRFIIILKKLVPLELYFYSKMFWVRSANKDFSMDSSTFSDYEVHFTVMNYNTFGMQTIYDKQFVEYLKEKNVSWDDIYDKIKSSVKNIFLMAGKDCPQMTDAYSRAIYGLDIMIDEDLEPKVLELNYSPDCTRACKFIPEFFNDIFSTLFLEHAKGVESV
jgi:hypothetical protein